MEAVDTALQRCLQDIKKDLNNQTQKLQEAEKQISNLEDDIGALQGSFHSAEQAIQILLEKVET